MYNLKHYNIIIAIIIILHDFKLSYCTIFHYRWIDTSGWSKQSGDWP